MSRVIVQHSIDFKNVLFHVHDMLDKFDGEEIKNMLENIKQLVTKNELYNAIEVIDDLNNDIIELNYRLEECKEILLGYQKIKIDTKVFECQSKQNQDSIDNNTENKLESIKQELKDIEEEKTNKKSEYLNIEDESKK